MTPPLLQVEALHKSFAGLPALAGLSCAVAAGETVGVVGPNGSGKTTLFNVLTGLTAADSGRALYRGAALTGSRPDEVARRGVARTFQQVRLVRGLSTLENVMLAFAHQGGEDLWSALLARRAWRRAEAQQHERAQEILSQFHLTAQGAALAESLSFGQQKLLSLACCVAAQADLLLLDEPLAGLAPDLVDTAVIAMQHLRQAGRSILLIDHNLPAASRVCDRFLFIDGGRVICEGSLQDLRDSRLVLDSYLS